MPSKEFLIASRDAYMQRAQTAEKQHRIAHENAEVLMNFIKRNCRMLEVTKERALEEDDYLQIEDSYYLVEVKFKERLN